MKDGVEIEISKGELRLRVLAGVGRVGVGEDLVRVSEYVVEKIILEVLSGEGMAVGVLEGDDLFLLLLLVRGGSCSGHRWAGGGDTVVVVVSCQTCPNREESDRQPQIIIIILVTTSSNIRFLVFESILHSLSLAWAAPRFLMAPVQVIVFLCLFSLRNLAHSWPITSQPDQNSLRSWNTIFYPSALSYWWFLYLYLRACSPDEHHASMRVFQSTK